MNKILKQGVCTFGLMTGLFMVQPANAQDSPSLQTLTDAVAVGVSTNPEYGVVASSRRATDEELGQAEALYLPSVDLNADTGYEYTDDPSLTNDFDFDSVDDDDNEESYYRSQVGLTVTQLLFDGWDTKYEIERQQSRIESASHRVRETAEFIGLDIAEAYLEVLRQRQTLQIARDNVASHMDILNQITDGVEAGRSTQADVEQARARLSSAQATEASTREDLRVAESLYRREVGALPKDLSVPRAPVEALEDNVEQEVDAALVHSPTIDVLESDVRVADAEYNKTQSSLYPQLDLQLNARQGHNVSGIEGRDQSASGLVTMNWNLYRGGADMARAREFIHRISQEKEERADGARSVENDVRQTWAAMISAGERARAFQDQVTANQQVVTAYKDQFDLNRRTLLDVLDAQNELFVSRTNAVNSGFVEMNSIYRLLALKGKLLPTLGIEYPRESVVKNM